MTIGIATLSLRTGFIVAASDHRISYDDLFPATEEGARKIIYLTLDKRWHVVFAASNVALFKPVALRLITRLRAQTFHDQQLVSSYAEEAYSHVLREEFAARHLSQMGYKSVEDFRKNGLQELGKETYDDLTLKLYKFDIGVEMLIFGINATRLWFSRSRTRAARLISLGNGIQPWEADRLWR